ncbi:MAG TPA: SigE family RNA polymerase sigma factor [Pseudonocardiaceae bacterium]|nr:SigE family RNA polymerase sigma factor [Pseudonocardiaceae bacterium]
MGAAKEDFVEFVAHRSGALLRTAYLLCGGDQGAAEDLLQDVLERTYPRWQRITGPPEAYLRAALANMATNRWRTRSRRVAETPLLEFHQPSVAAHDSRIADRDEVVRALAKVPPRMRAVLVLRFFDDLSEAQAAAALGCSVGTIKSQTSRGLDALRKVMVAEPDPPQATVMLIAQEGQSR